MDYNKTEYVNGVLYNGDCLEVMKLIPDKSIDMIFCDLPYGSTACRWDSIINVESLWLEYNRIIKDNGAIVLFGNNPFSSVLISGNIKNYKYDWIIEKSHVTGHLNAKKMPMKAHEFIHVFYKKPPIYNPQKTFGHERKTSKASSKINCKKTEDYGEHGLTDYDSTERYPRSVLKFKWDKQKSTLHPTQKPLDLCKYMIKTYTNEGMTVLDNCIGSGTTAVACIELNRICIGIESDEIIFNVVKERIENAIKKEN